jgi:hypothetical protein
VFFEWHSEDLFPEAKTQTNKGEFDLSLIFAEVRGHETRQKPKQAGEVEVYKDEHPSDQEGMKRSEFLHVYGARQMNNFAVHVAH